MNITKETNEKVDDYFKRLSQIGYSINTTYQGVSLEDIETLLTKIGKYNVDIRDVIWCLLNDEFPSLFANNPDFTIADGASVAHIGGYIGILLRKGNRLDREGRDYWIKPLREIGAVEEITLSNGEFLLGHIKAKSPNSSYRLNRSFVDLLKQVKNYDFDNLLKNWISSKSINTRLAIHLDTVKINKANQCDSSHKALILDSVSIYAKHFLKEYILIFIDAEDGDRVTEEEQKRLEKYQIKFGNLSDVWPDAILYNINLNALWFIEAVTSDGEVDEHKMRGLKKICENSNKSFGGATTTYFDWKRASARQQKEKNLAYGSFFWVKETPEKHFQVL